ncbi:MAG: hypothetical protein HQL54_06840 [Magnetococcales bacterium]|nr:hypothetical protein [Magnetococcales bacterium]
MRGRSVRFNLLMIVLAVLVSGCHLVTFEIPEEALPAPLEMDRLVGQWKGSGGSPIQSMTISKGENGWMLADVIEEEQQKLTFRFRIAQMTQWTVWLQDMSSHERTLKDGKKQKPFPFSAYLTYGLEERDGMVALYPLDNSGVMRDIGLGRIGGTLINRCDPEIPGFGSSETCVNPDAPLIYKTTGVDLGAYLKMAAAWAFQKRPALILSPMEK